MKQFATLTIIFLTIVACAKIGSPPGGPKDEDPPQVLKAKPENFAVNYNRDKILIYFDEYIVMDNIYQEFTVSPPLEERPLPVTRGKNIFIEFVADELDTATYTLDFGQSIKDNNEGNPFPNFQFVVSKASHIDSFAVSGKLVDAYNHKPDEEMMFVFLHKNLHDSAITTTIPSYLGRTNPDGEFKINYVAPGTYNLFAVKDANSDNIYNPETEVFAFANEPIHLIPDSFPPEPDMADSALIGFPDMYSDTANIALMDSIMADSLLADSLLADSLLADSMEITLYGYAYNLYSFKQTPKFEQYLDDYNRDSREKLKMWFNEAMDEPVVLEALEPDTMPKDWYILQNNPTNDTLVFWLADSSIIKIDTIKVTVDYLYTDTNDVLVPRTDTLLFRARKEKTKENNNRRNGGGGGLANFIRGDDEVDTVPKEIKKPRVKISNNINPSTHDLNVPVRFTSEAPIFNFNPELFEVVRMEDTIEVPIKYTFEPYPNDFLKFGFNFALESKTQYKIKMYENCLEDIYERSIDSTVLAFTTQREDAYGIIKLTVDSVYSPVIIQLLDEKEAIVQSKSTDKNATLVFDYLKPAKYMLKAIFDDNANGKWDTGKYSEKLQPEKVLYYPTEIQAKENWEIEQNWTFGEE